MCLLALMDWVINIASVPQPKILRPNLLFILSLTFFLFRNRVNFFNLILKENWFLEAFVFFQSKLNSRFQLKKKQPKTQ